MRGIAFFSGGKDGLYATYLAQKRGISITYFLVLKATIGVSSHYENISELEKLAEAMGKEPLIYCSKTTWSGSNGWPKERALKSWSPPGQGHA